MSTQEPQKELKELTKEEVAKVLSPSSRTLRLFRDQLLME